MRIVVIAFAAAAAFLFSGPARSDAIMAPGGWTYRVAPTGTVFFECRAQSCGGPSALASYHRQNDGPLRSEEEFRADAEQKRLKMIALSGGRIVDIRTLGFAAKKEKGLKAYSVFRAVQSRTNPVSYNASAEVSNGRLHYTVVSTAATDAAARANLEVFIPIALMTAMINENAGKQEGARSKTH